MPTYEVRRRTVLLSATVTAANETEARTLARDAWQTDAAIASLAADVKRVPNLDPFDQYLDEVSEQRYEQPDTDRETELREQVRMGLWDAGKPSREPEPW